MTEDRHTCYAETGNPYTEHDECKRCNDSKIKLTLKEKELDMLSGGHEIGKAARIGYKDFVALIAQARLALKYKAALEKIAAWNDHSGSAHLDDTGSYALFDEPASVKIAREALKEEK